MPEDTQDYAKSGLDIQYAMLDRAKGSETKNPTTIRWGPYEVKTADSIQVPELANVRGEFLSVKDDVEQGFDLKINGYFELRDGQKVSALRTWHDPALPTVVEYPLCSKDGLIWVWNVYKRVFGSGQAVEEKWTGNAGCWVEEVSQAERIYHCSHGAMASPDFESLVFKLTIIPRVYT